MGIGQSHSNSPFLTLQEIDLLWWAKVTEQATGNMTRMDPLRRIWDVEHHTFLMCGCRNNRSTRPRLGSNSSGSISILCYGSRVKALCNSMDICECPTAGPT